jgi:hypothetical protein
MLGAQGMTKIAVGLGQVGVEPDCLAILGYRLVKSAQRSQCAAKVDVKPWVVGPELGSSTKCVNRLTQLPFISKGDTEVTLRLGVFRL